ncbi:MULTISPECIES: L-serine ammonia-lyase [Vibrio]|jgi:L-serine dehydratase|uniref:L-serine dehydratase n=1 Tax=Vibrio cyclitrophicus ZF270 TaxID=1136176 RepID=A0AAN0NAL7_9VIBR|nr:MULTISPECIES: L-serine ammonia-lyase [Vibrio]KNH11240.1 serine dehydratase [Vibrio lentus]KAA8599108.1 L-serine dehydratase beta subunit [Vibrio cyclitrophicus]MBE8556562.1 L-serine ammonia-lyase [Vibrio sp. OPT24]MBE8606246.1 L-serine ammonia-lyase [Vibrio sp. OPT10]MBU2932358.1 L-serine ammonia-lyase [Vibrio cyclitrophicus]|tara:strand:+ start:350 stop:1720 length:1371 start_codon:yes stop_codon:yes gene_type:complete
MLSIFDIYKIGVGPSSSHTNGPMIAGFNFTQKIEPVLGQVTRIQIDLYGSLSLTGIGHHTDRATLLGLLGNRPDTIKITSANLAMRKAIEDKSLMVSGSHEIHFDAESDLLFHKTNLPLHENGMTISAFDASGSLLEMETYYSIGGGFIATADELQHGKQESKTQVEFPFSSADQLLELSDQNGLSLGGLVLRNEISFQGMDVIDQKADQIWKVMSLCMQRGFDTEGILDGGLDVTRRAPALLKKLEANASIENDPMEIMDWINLFAFAVSEENAAGGQVVTSPTNGAAGVIPAVLMYYHRFIKELDTKQLKDFLAVSGAIGILYKTNASISGAEVGCQGEVGVSSSMAAAGLTALRGGSNEQICIAAEIAMEHSLGMTCDPIGGLVQVPCIERNAMGAMKAINASRMALKRTSKCLISLDKVIATMYQTGKDMNKKYRETSLGGLAVIHMAPPCE